MEGWDLAYLKFCCKVQGIRSELFANDTCKVVALEEIKGHFPQGTTFEDYWPAKVLAVFCHLVSFIKTLLPENHC